MSQIPELQKVAEEAGAVLMPIVGTEGHCLYIKGSGHGFFSNETLETMEPEKFSQLVDERSRPAPSRPLDFDPVEQYISSSRARSPITGHYRGGDR